MAQSTETPLPRAPLQGQPVSSHYGALRRLIGCWISAQVRDKVAVLGKEGEKLMLTGGAHRQWVWLPVILGESLPLRLRFPCLQKVF